MRVVLEVATGPVQGKPIVLLAGQRLQVGRTERADIAFPQDGRMSSIHFLLEAEDEACYVCDLNSTNGTFLNGRQLSARSPLQSGDQVQAGDTVFVVHSGEGRAVTEACATPGPVAASAGSALSTVQSPAATAVKICYTVEKCDAGPLLYRGSVEQISPHHLAAMFGTVYPLFLMVDFRKLAIPRPQAPEATDYLFDWLTPQAAAIASPVLFASDEVATWPKIVEEGWGMDALVCLFSKQDRSALREHWRQALRGKRKREGMGTGMIGYCWPSVLAMMLSHGKPSQVMELLAGVEAVLVEMPDLPETWQIYAQKPITEVLGRLGLVESKSEMGLPA